MKLSISNEMEMYDLHIFFLSYDDHLI